MAERKSKIFKDSAFGACSYDKTSPQQLAQTTRAVNVVLSFDEALKLNLAVDEGVRKLGRYNRARAGLMLIVHFDKKRIRVRRGSSNCGSPNKPLVPTRSGRRCCSRHSGSVKCHGRRSKQLAM